MTEKRMTDRRKAAVNIAAKHRDKAEDVIQAWYEIMQDKEAPEASRIAAGEKIMDRILGRSPQGVELTGEDGDAIQTEVTIKLIRPEDGGS